MAEVLDPEIRKRIYDFIAEHPGTSSGRIAEFLNINPSRMEQYIQAMKEKKEIIPTHGDGHTRYFIRKRRRGRQGARDQRTQEIRKRIYDVVVKNPGLNLSKIAEMLNMSPQLAEYHLLYLQRNNIILGVKEKGGYYKRFYVKDSDVGTREKRIVALLRQEHLLNIVLAVLRHPNIKHKKLSQFLDIHPSTLSHHLNRLDECGLFDVITYGKESGYRVKNRKEIIWLIRRYILDVIVEGFRDMWEELDPR
jgi:predicted transcriptional regulator